MCVQICTRERKKKIQILISGVSSSTALLIPPRRFMTSEPRAVDEDTLVSGLRSDSADFPYSLGPCYSFTAPNNRRGSSKSAYPSKPEALAAQPQEQPRWLPPLAYPGAPPDHRPAPALKAQPPRTTRDRRWFQPDCGPMSDTLALH